MAFLLAFVFFGSLCETDAGASLTDLSGHWSAPFVTTLVQAGSVGGYPDGTFRPDNTISTAEFVKIVAAYRGVSQPSSYSRHWAAAWMEGARLAGYYDWDEIVPDGSTFDAPISRQLAIKIIMKAFLPQATGEWSISSSITDWSGVSGRYYNAILAAYSEKIADGYPDGSFRPLGTLTRGEACALLCRARTVSGVLPATQSPATTPTTTPETAVRGGVSENGWLQVNGTQLCNGSGRPVILHGMSSHGIQWYPQYASKAAIHATTAYGATVFRVAMYTEEGGYLTNPSCKTAVCAAVDAAVAEGIYVIIDWHILSDGNPQTHQAQAVAFFREISARYGQTPNVLYEICNEPNGAVTWSGNIKPYAQAVIPVIRANAPKAVILVGTPTWSQDVDQAAADPLPYDNVLYTCHFYAGTHGDALRSKIDRALKLGAPIFVSEWGTSEASGTGGPYLAAAQTWLAFLAQRGISWCNWSLCDKGETSAALRSGCTLSNGIQAGELTASGAFVFAHFGVS